MTRRFTLRDAICAKIFAYTLIHAGVAFTVIPRGATTDRERPLVDVETPSVLAKELWPYDWMLAKEEL